MNKGIRPGEIITFYFTTSDASQNLKKSVFVLQDAENNQIAKFEFSNITKRNLRAKSAINPHGKDLVPSYKYLPQRYPLLVIDNIAKENGTTGYANKLVSYGDFAFRKALSAETNEASLFYPFGAIIEGIEQSAALVLSNLWAVSDKEYEISIAGFSNIELHSHVSPGETLQFQSELEYQSDMHAIFSGIASVNNRITVSISKVFVVIKPLVRND